MVERECYSIQKEASSWLRAVLARSFESHRSICPRGLLSDCSPDNAPVGPPAQTQNRLREATTRMFDSTHCPFTLKYDDHKCHGGSPSYMWVKFRSLSRHRKDSQCHWRSAFSPAETAEDHINWLPTRFGRYYHISGGGMSLGTMSYI